MINADVIIILVYLRHRDFERNHGYRLIKVWLFVLTLRLFRSQVQSFPTHYALLSRRYFLPWSQRYRSKVFWSRLVFSLWWRCDHTVITVKRFLPRLLTLFLWSHRDHGQTFLATTTKVFFCDHTVITAWSRVKSFNPWSRIVITPVITPIFLLGRLPLDPHMSAKTEKFYF